MNIEVQIYLQRLKAYVENNEEAKSYLVGSMSMDDFMENAEKYAIENFQKRGNPLLTIDQFEEIQNEHKTPKIFFSLNGFGDICLN